jgi:hypothetical protein
LTSREIETEELSVLSIESAFLAKFAKRRLLKALALFDAAARKVPPLRIRELDEENLFVANHDHPAAERRRSEQTPVKLNQSVKSGPPDHQLTFAACAGSSA